MSHPMETHFAKKAGRPHPRAPHLPTMRHRNRPPEIPEDQAIEEGLREWEQTVVEGGGGRFSPTYAYPPGETLAEVLESRSMSQVELAERTELTPKTVNEIIKGKAPVTPDTALHLERVLGLPASFWNNLQRRFDEVRAQEAEAKRLEHAMEWARRFPLTVEEGETE